MNKEIKDKWIAELRSGKYQQGMGRLKREIHKNNYEVCCLAILCDIIAPDKWTRKETQGEFSIHIQHACDGNMFTVSDRLLGVTGMARVETEKCENMNDVQRKTFNEIADWIEANL